MCAQGRPDENEFGIRVLAGTCSDTYLQRADVGQRGYTIVIWRGRHVADPTELTESEMTAYFSEVLRVGRAVEQLYRPIKLNFELLGNSLPHLHTHVVPRYADDGAPGTPPRFMKEASSEHALRPEGELRAEADQLRRLLS